MPAFAIYDLAGVEPNSRFENMTGSAEATTRVGRAADLSGNGRDIAAISETGRPVAETGYTDFTDIDQHRLASAALSFSGYVCIKFREDSRNGIGNQLIARGEDNSEVYLVGDTGGSAGVTLLSNTGTQLPSVFPGSGDHILEIWRGSPARYSLDGSAIADADDNWAEGLLRIVIGGRNIGVSNRAWLGRIYRCVFWPGGPTGEERDSVHEWVDGGDNLQELLNPPPTPAEVFRASFEDASGRDPLPTALLERLPARKLVGHTVLCYLYPPMIAQKTIPVRLEDYDKTVPGMMIWIKDQYDPLFKMGRWGQIQGRKFPSDPTIIELTVRISDHPESFVEPNNEPVSGSV